MYAKVTHPTELIEMTLSTYTVVHQRNINQSPNMKCLACGAHTEHAEAEVGDHVSEAESAEGGGQELEHLGGDREEAQVGF